MATAEVASATALRFSEWGSPIFRNSRWALSAASILLATSACHDNSKNKPKEEVASAQQEKKSATESQPPPDQPPPPAKRESAPCRDDTLITRRVDMKIEGLDIPIPVWNATDFPIPKDQTDRFLEHLLTYFVEATPFGAINLFLHGKTQKAGIGIPPGKIILAPDDKTAYPDVTMRCDGFQGDKNANAQYSPATNTIYLKIDPNQIRGINFSRDFDVGELDLTVSLFHEFAHALDYSLNGKMTTLRVHYNSLFHKAFPNQKDYERYFHIVDRAYSGSPTKAELWEFWHRFVPIIEKHFINYHAASRFGEYFAANCAAYLITSKKQRSNRERLKSLDPVAYDLLKSFFENGATDTKALGE